MKVGHLPYWLRSAWMLLIFCALPDGFAQQAERLTVRPTEDTLAALHNPGMGWVLYENFPLDQDPQGSSTMLSVPNEEFSVVDAVALMFSWQDIETREGEYDFSKANQAYEYWKKRGKEIQLRVSSESLLWWSTRQPPAGKGMPDYVAQRIDDSKKQVRDAEGITYVVVDARDRWYQDRLAKFLQAVAGNFSAPREVVLVDLRGYGLWGEWHTGYQYPSLDARREALCRIIDLYAEAFPRHRVALSYSYDPDSPAELRSGPAFHADAAYTRQYREYLRYSAFDHALTKPNVTYRRDGAGGAVHPNERRLCEEAFFSLSRGPMMSEFLGGFHAAKKGGRAWVDRIVNDALSLHPNYVCVLGWQGVDARDFVRERPELIEHGLRTMGYRLMPIEVSYPVLLPHGKPFRIEMEWVNRGVGRSTRPFNVQFRLIDDKNHVAASCDGGLLGADQWVRDRTYRVSAEITLADVPAGDYRLQIGLVDAPSGRRIALPLVATAGEGFYWLGGCRVGP